MTYTAPYTLTDHLTTIRRELEKRRSAYPKIMAKKVKEGYTQAEQIALATTQRIQYELLTEAENALLEVTHPDANTAEAIWRELLREYRMRKKCYPRWVAFTRMNEETARRELLDWMCMADDFHAHFCPDAPLRASRKKTKI